MPWPDEKIVAILALMIIAIVVVFVTKNAGLDVVINIVCTTGGFITGASMVYGKSGNQK